MKLRRVSRKKIIPRFVRDFDLAQILKAPLSQLDTYMNQINSSAKALFPKDDPPITKRNYMGYNGYMVNEDFIRGWMEARANHEQERKEP